MIQSPGRACGAVGHRQVEQRFLQTPAELGGASRTAADRAVGGNDERCIRVTNVPARAHVVSSAAGFFEAIAARDNAVFGSWPFRTPTSVAHAPSNGPIQRRAIHTGLAAGNDFEPLAQGCPSAAFVSINHAASSGLLN